MDPQKYELTTQTTVTDQGIVLKRIRALVDLPFHRVHAGDLGGWISTEHNLSHEGQCWIAEEATVTESAVVRGDAIVQGNARVTDCATVQDTARIAGSAVVAGDAVIGGVAVVTAGAYIFGGIVGMFEVVAPPRALALLRKP